MAAVTMNGGVQDPERREKSFKLLHAREWTIPMCRKSSKGGRRHAWLNKELLTKLKHKKEAYKKWKEDPGDPEGI